MYDLCLFVVAGLMCQVKPKVKRQSTAAKPEPVGASVRVPLMNQEAKASGSGSGSGETMQKNDQGDEYLKVSHSRSEISVG